MLPDADGILEVGVAAAGSVGEYTREPLYERDQRGAWFLVR